MLANPRLKRAMLLALCALVACKHWNERKVPEVEQAAVAYEAGLADAASELLAEYLHLCPEDDASTDTRKLNAEFDYGLVLYRLLESYGKRLGTAPAASTPGGDLGEREAACAKKVLERLLASKELSNVERIEALYVLGNLNFMMGKRKEALAAYDRALELAGGAAENGSSVAQNAAFNRALALRESPPPDGGKDGSPPPPPDGSSDGSPPPPPDGSSDGSPPPPPDGGSDGSPPPPPDGGKDGGGNPDGGTKPDSGGDDNKPDAGNDDGEDAGAPPPPEPQERDGGKDAEATPTEVLDERVFEQLDKTPSLQREMARRFRRRTKPSEDK
jgi:hypothetical protein